MGEHHPPSERQKGENANILPADRVKRPARPERKYHTEVRHET